jgi:hypothetical protein
MSKWAIVFNHSDGEFWVYPSPHPLYGELPLGNELTALENIKLYQKKVRVDLTIWNAPNWDAAMQAAREMNESRHYQEIDTLERYAP